MEIINAHSDLRVSGVTALGPCCNPEAIDRAAVRCVLQRGSSRQNPMRRRTVESWNMLMKEARLFCVVALDAAVLLSAAHSLCYYTALAMASLRTVLSPMQKRMLR